MTQLIIYVIVKCIKYEIYNIYFIHFVTVTTVSNCRINYYFFIKFNTQFTNQETFLPTIIQI